MNEDRADSELGRIAAKVLLDCEAVLFQPDHPFIFSSGWASPVYVQCRKAISYPMARDALVELSIKRILSVLGYAALDGIAGAEGGGVPFASIIADRMHLPLVVARKQSAGMGRNAQTDGVVHAGQKLLLIDDLTTDGRTKAVMCAALRKNDAIVNHAFVVFRYGIFDAVMTDEDLGVQLFSLLTWRELLATARAENVFSSTTLDTIDEYVADPLQWSSRHGGR